MTEAGPSSPCIGVCALDPASGTCTGCHRTLDEIAGWPQYSPEEKREVLRRIDGRRRERRQPARPGR